MPNGIDETVYLVTDDFGDLGRVWRETDVETADLETVIKDLLDGQCNNPGAGYWLQHSGRARIFPRRLPMKFGGAAISGRLTRPSVRKGSSISTSVGSPTVDAAVGVSGRQTASPQRNGGKRPRLRPLPTY